TSGARYCLPGGVEKALYSGPSHARFARRDVIEFAVLHPLLEPVHEAKQVIERVDDEQQRLVMMDLERLVDRPLELDRVALHVGRIDRVLDLAVRAEQPASIHTQAAPRRHHAEFDGEPKEPSHRCDNIHMRLQTPRLITTS